ncbi:MAG TPA: carbon monoxide dehydrogenase subunit G [Gemmatimonadales bacterium]|nr:carbon monoxide dehydrogenase subunit G [Gemmatimonadales bacterium]
MIVEGTHTFPGPREVVWALLLDPDVLAMTMPGATSITRVSEDRYEGKMGVGIGPITAAEFDVVITMTEKIPPEQYQMQIDGRGRFGFTRGKAAVTLVADGDSTVMHYAADMTVGGKIAAVGQRLLDSVSRMMLKQGLEAMSAELDRRLGKDNA